jgi:hypothetical protein
MKRLENAGQLLTAQEKNLAGSTAAVASSAVELEARLKAMQNPDGIIEIKLQPFIRGFTKAIRDQSTATAAQMAELQQIIGQFDQSVRQMTELMGALARESASDRKELREFATNAQADTAEIRRLLSELEKKISANPTANGGRAEAPRRWLFGGGSS